MIVQPIKDVIKSEGYDIPTKVLSSTKKYFVYAIEGNKNSCIYFIYDDSNSSFPMHHDSTLFRTVDKFKPTNWEENSTGFWIFKSFFQSFPEWANDTGKKNNPGFYARLIDSYPDGNERNIMSRYRNEYENDIGQ